MIRITEDDFDIGKVIRAAKSDEAGAVVTFLGTVRDDGINAIEVEAYREAVVSQLEEIRSEAMSRFNLKSADIIHRSGLLAVGENIVIIACAAAHRKEAFDGCSYIIEEIKARVPIWKKEKTEEGDRWIGL